MSCNCTVNCSKVAAGLAISMVVNGDSPVPGMMRTEVQTLGHQSGMMNTYLSPQYPSSTLFRLTMIFGKAFVNAREKLYFPDSPAVSGAMRLSSGQ